MTEGHKHRLVRVTPRVMRLMRKPLIHCRDLDRVDASPYPYGPCNLSFGKNPTCWTLSLLSILHRWTGLTLYVGPPEEKPDERAGQ